MGSPPKLVLKVSEGNEIEASIRVDPEISCADSITAVSSEGRTALPKSSSRPLPAPRPNHAT